MVKLYETKKQDLYQSFGSILFVNVSLGNNVYMLRHWRK